MKDPNVGSELALWQAYCDKKMECEALEEANSQLQQTIDNLVFKYGDAWYDGFMEALKIETEDGNLSEYDSYTASLLSEEAKQVWLLSKMENLNE